MLVMICTCICIHAQGWEALEKSFTKLPLRKARRVSRQVLSDVFHGKYVQQHEELGFEAEDDGSRKCAFGAYLDGINCVNPLGAFSGRHTLCMFYVQLFNLPPEQRQRFSNIFLVCVAYEHEAKDFGMQQVLMRY